MKIKLELLIIVIFCWLFFKAIGLAFKVAWGAAKIAASVLFTIAIPMLIWAVIFAGGVVLLIPVALVAAAFGLLKACLD